MKRTVLASTARLAMLILLVGAAPAFAQQQQDGVEGTLPSPGQASEEHATPATDEYGTAAPVIDGSVPGHQYDQYGDPERDEPVSAADAAEDAAKDAAEGAPDATEPLSAAREAAFGTAKAGANERTAEETVPPQATTAVTGEQDAPPSEKGAGEEEAGGAYGVGGSGSRSIVELPATGGLPPLTLGAGTLFLLLVAGSLAARRVSGEAVFSSPEPRTIGKTGTPRPPARGVPEG